MRWLLPIGVVSYVVGLALFVPARFVVEEFFPAAKARENLLAVQNISGNFLQGNANLLFRGRAIGGVHWRLHPLSLLFGRLGANVAIAGSDMHASGLVEAAFGPEFIVQDLKGSMSMDKLPLFLPANRIKVSPTGELAWEIEYAVFSDGMAKSVEGAMSWKRAEIRYPARLALGDLDLSLATDPAGVIRGVLSDQGGELITRGNLILNPDQSYDVDLELGARNDPQGKLKQALAMLGRPDSRGITKFSYKGKL